MLLILDVKSQKEKEIIICTTYRIFHLFTVLKIWFCRLEHPVKRPKRDNKMECKPSYNSSNQTSASAHLSAKMLGAERDTPPSPQVPAHDPYEFSDEASSSAGDFTKRGSLRQSREDSISRPNSFNTKLVI